MVILTMMMIRMMMMLLIILNKKIYFLGQFFLSVKFIWCHFGHFICKANPKLWVVDLAVFVLVHGHNHFLNLLPINLDNLKMLKMTSRHLGTISPVKWVELSMNSMSCVIYVESILVKSDMRSKTDPDRDNWNWLNLRTTSFQTHHEPTPQIFLEKRFTTLLCMWGCPEDASEQTWEESFWISFYTVGVAILQM